MDKCNNRIKMNDRGISLVEVIVVVLIIGITSSVAVIGISFAYNSSANRAAEMTMSKFDLVRTQSMSMVSDSLALRIKKSSNGTCYIQTVKKVSGQPDTIIDTEELCSSLIDIYYEDSAQEYLLSNGNYIDITFKKNTGGIKEDYKTISYKRDNKVTLKLVSTTGRCYIK